MNHCENCPYPKRCEAQERCIVHKITNTPVILPQPTPQPIETTSGVKMSGIIKKGKKK